MCSATAPSDVLLPPELSSGRLARAFVAEHWCPVHGDAALDRVRLLVTELVSNAVRHGRPPVVLTLECAGEDGVVVSVSDGSREPPVPRQVGPEALGGRGVRLVDVLSAEWGVAHHHACGGHLTAGAPGAGEGKTVWCRLLN